jgi:hypothetical protein
MRRAEKIRLANEAATQAAASDDRDQSARDSARREWGQVRKAAREAFLKKADWKSILNAYRDMEGFYTAVERAKMCAAYEEELVMNTHR